MISVDELAKAIAKHIKVPLSVELWGPDEIAEYLKVSRRTVAEKYACLPDFPSPIRLPSKGDQGLLRWKAQEVIDFIERKKAKPGRPRNAA